MTIRQSNAGTAVTEGGATDTNEITLDSIPTSDVTITVTSDGQLDPGNGAGVAINLTFTPQNALDPQTIAVVAQDNSIIEGDQIAGKSHVKSRDC